MIAAALLSIPALLLALVAWLAYRRRRLARLLTVAIVFGVGYWYVLPGTLFLSGGPVAEADLDLLGASTAIWQALLLIHACLALLLLLPAGFGWLRAPRLARPEIPLAAVSARRLDAVLLAAVFSSAALLAYRYAELGPAFALQLLLGLASAREVMTFENTSSGPAQSLLALWEIASIFVAIFLAATYTWQRRALSIRFVGAGIAVLLAFVSSGSRSVLLLLLFAVAMALICRPPAAQARAAVRRRQGARRLLPLLLMAGLVAVAGLAMLARFQDDPSQSESLALNSIGSHNDMFRELVFVLRNGWHYRADAGLFLQTPISFAMPSFLGFSKSLPPHLIDFNFDRAGIDLVSGEGNVFPGLLADLWLNFGVFTPLALAGLSALLFSVFIIVSTRGASAAVNWGLLVTLLCYFVISYRNIQGSFVILALLAAVLSAALSARPADPLKSPRSRRRSRRADTGTDLQPALPGPLA